MGQVAQHLGHLVIGPGRGRRDPELVAQPGAQRGGAPVPPALAAVEFGTEQAERRIVAGAQREVLLGQGEDLLVGEPGHF
jgi:hypothetical protein